MRTVQVIDQSSGSITRADHVIGIDESGTFGDPNPFALAAVRCPREKGERLAELLLENDLAPWQAKSQTITRNISAAERNRRVQGLIESLNRESIPWRVAVCFSRGGIDHKAAGVCVLAKKTITSFPEFSGDSVLLPDGEANMYGSRQEKLRTQASQIFDGSFQSKYGGMYVTALTAADLTYPEVTAADYIAGFVRGAVDDGVQVREFPDEVMWFDNNWREPSVSPVPFYKIRGLSGEYGSVARTRVAAWVKGRNTDGDDYDVSSQWRNTLEMIESPDLRQYLSEVIAP